MRSLQFTPTTPDSKTGPDENTHTYYQVFIGPGTPFEKKQQLTSVQISDGTSNTLAIVEAAEMVPWTKPEDIPFGKAPVRSEVGGIFNDGFNGRFVDGRVRFISKATNEQRLRRLITPNEGQPVNIP